MAKTKKVKSSGRFGARYGMKARKRHAAIEMAMKAPHICPRCSRPSLKRSSTGIWRCRKCSAEFTGGAYLPRTSVAKDMDRALKGILKTGG
ncbi:MAG: 50S ribosomal protein L37ae [Methanobacteriota archaeon]|nr:MAG: 50S ribosomal protein L37ae [Euryarchaeota archaeon]